MKKFSNEEHFCKNIYTIRYGNGCTVVGFYSNSKRRANISFRLHWDCILHYEINKCAINTFFKPITLANDCDSISRIMNRKNASLNIFILTFADETVNHT
jgi:hypothetical protein